MKYAYFPGCSAESTARDMHQSTLAVAEALGIELIEPKGWTCCGATAGHQTDRILAAALPAATLVKAKDMGLDLVVNCAACYNRMKVANHEIASNKQVRAKVEEWLKVQQEMLGEASDPDDPATFLGYYKPHTFTLHWDDEAAFEFRHTPGFLSLEAAIEWAREELVHDHSPDVYIDEVDPRDKFNYLRRFWINQEYEVCREEEGSLPLAEALDPDDPESFVRRMPVDMRQWLMQMGFEDHSGSSSVCIAYFVRPRIKNGLLIVKCVSDVNRWYAEAMDDLHTVASARGKPEVVRAEVEKWLQQ